MWDRVALAWGVVCLVGGVLVVVASIPNLGWLPELAAIGGGAVALIGGLCIVAARPVDRRSINS
jgi:hypothetical protein